MLAALPASDVTLSAAAPLVSYTHRRLRDADVYFVFNSGDDPLALDATLVGRGTAQVWDADSGKVAALAGTTATTNGVRVPLTLAPWTTTTLVIGGGAPAITDAR